MSLMTCKTCDPGHMQITVDLPDDIAQHAEPGREALERLAIQGYRSGALTHHQAGQLLGLSRIEFDDFLIEHKIYDHAYSIVDLQQDLADLEKLRAQALLRK
jgi:predicted HTH domain antitoxin